MTNLRYEFAAAVILMAALVRLQATRVLKRLLLLLLLLPRRLRHQRPKLLRATVDLILLLIVKSDSGLECHSAQLVRTSTWLFSRIMHYSRRESFANEPSLRFFFRARFRAKACFTRRLSPGFK